MSWPKHCTHVRQEAVTATDWRSSMSQKGVEGLLGRMVTDKDFRQRFYQEPAATCVAEAMEVPTRELEAVQRLDEARLADFAKHLDTRIVRASVTGGVLHARQVAGVSGMHSEPGEDRLSRPKTQRARYERRPA